jgi:hypothetical protein
MRIVLISLIIVGLASGLNAQLNYLLHRNDAFDKKVTIYHTLICKEGEIN